ncbi:hypothetical protein GE061_010082 [Apolygus lucorum]|uniref:Peptidase S1 domain-containing protein n=1 Tax=Apolygus lucorum TaxID=248454 RepID=A0A8S9Y229_APOLU|nr:hypothetical protein GE061_010082 [Apolygus lucorum]
MYASNTSSAWYHSHTTKKSIKLSNNGNSRTEYRYFDFDVRLTSQMMKWFLLVAAVAYASAHPRFVEDENSEYEFDGENEVVIYRDTTDSSSSFNGTNMYSGSRIIGGDFYKKNKYPFLVQICRHIPGNDDKYVCFCGGSIISNKHVITAAHCFEKFVLDEQKFFVMLGAHDLDELDGVNIDVAEVVMHSHYNRTTVRNDIAMLTLSHSVDFTSVIGPVCLPEGGLDVTNENVTVLGWGMEEYGDDGTTKPKELNTTVIDIVQCHDDWFFESGRKVIISTENPTVLCYQSKEGKSCRGDSGGPVVWFDDRNNKYFLVGIVSYGGTHCNLQRPTVNTLVTAYLEWIKQNMDVPDFPPRCTMEEEEEEGEEDEEREEDEEE